MVFVIGFRSIFFSAILGIFMILLDYFWVISRRVVLLGINAAIMGKLISQNVRI